MYRTAIKLTLFCVIATLSMSCKTKTQAQTTDTNVEKREQRQERGQKGQRPSPAEMFTQMDANKDGMLSKTEVKGPLQKDFAKIDTNGDGFISKAELEKAPKPNRQGGPPNRG